MFALFGTKACPIHLLNVKTPTFGLTMMPNFFLKALIVAISFLLD